MGHSDGGGSPTALETAKVWEELERILPTTPRPEPAGEGEPSPRLAVAILAEGADAAASSARVGRLREVALERGIPRVVVFKSGAAGADALPFRAEPSIVTHIVLCSHFPAGSESQRVRILLQASGVRCEPCTPVMSPQWISTGKCAMAGRGYDDHLLAVYHAGADNAPAVAASAVEAAPGTGARKRGREAEPRAAAHDEAGNGPAPAARVRIMPRLAQTAVRQSFMCQQPLAVSTVDNEHLCKPLEDLAALYKVRPSGREQDRFRADAFARVAKALRGCGVRLETCDDLHAMLRGRKRGGAAWQNDKVFGATTVECLEKMLNANESGLDPRAGLDRLVELCKNEKVLTILSFARIWGVGIQTADSFYARGLRTLDDLVSARVLDARAQVGLRYLDELQQRIPRAEVARCAAVVRAVLLELVPAEQVAYCEPVGSYRRGKASSGDLDVLISLVEGAPSDGLLCRLLAALQARGFITDVLARPHAAGGAGDDAAGGEGDSQSFMGICRLSEPGALHRRIDMKVYPRAKLPFALLYFTGSDYFNRSMRHWAKLNGCRLSDRGLTLPGGEELECHTEVEIFEALGLEWREPHERDCVITLAGPADTRDVADSANGAGSSSHHAARGAAEGITRDDGGPGEAVDDADTSASAVRLHDYLRGITAQLPS